MLGFAPLGGLPLGGFQWDDHIALATGSFVLTGQDATLRAAVVRSLSAGTGSFALTGQASVKRLAMPAETGSFVLGGQAAGLSRGLYFRVSYLTASVGTQEFL